MGEAIQTGLAAGGAAGPASKNVGLYHHARVALEVLGERVDEGQGVEVDLVEWRYTRLGLHISCK